jgi:hypothetical protein
MSSLAAPRERACSTSERIVDVGRGELRSRDPSEALDVHAEAELDALLVDALDSDLSCSSHQQPRGVRADVDDRDQHRRRL